MRLFAQLSELEQENSIQHCFHIILDDMLDNGLDVDEEDDAKLKTEIDAVMAQIKAVEDIGEKIDFILNNEPVTDHIHYLAVDMARDAYYHSSDELIIYPEDLENDDDDDDNEVVIDGGLTEEEVGGKHQLN